MKKMKIFALIVLAGATMFTSCKKDDETVLADPTISFQGGTNSLVFNGTNSIDVNVTVAAEGKIEAVTLQGPSLSGTGTTTTPITTAFGTSGTDNAKNQTSATYLFVVSNITLAQALANHTTGWTYTFTVTDQEGKSTTATFTVTVPGAQNTPFATEITTGTFYHISGLLKGAWDLDANAEVASTGAAASKSMKNSDAAGATFTGSWASDAANGTQYVSTTTAYADIYQENAATIYAAGTANAAVVNPTAGKVYIGKKGTTYYVISITTVDPTFSTGTGANTGKITFKYKK